MIVLDTNVLSELLRQAPEPRVLVWLNRSTGRPISQFDATIAAITRSHGATLATRNAKDFEGCGIDVVNPWNR